MNERKEYNYESNIEETLSIPTFLKIQVSDFYTLISLMAHTYNYHELKTIDIYFWLVFKITNGEYLGKYKVNYELSFHLYKMETRVDMSKGYIDNRYLLIPQIIMIKSNLFQIKFNRKIINNEDHIGIDVESFNSIFSDTSDKSYNFNLFQDHNYGNFDWKVILETPKSGILQPLIKYPNFEIKETKVYPYFWNNNNIAIKVQYYLGAIADPIIEILDGESIFECFILLAYGLICGDVLGLFWRHNW